MSSFYSRRTLLSLVGLSAAATVLAACASSSPSSSASQPDALGSASADASGATATSVPTTVPEGMGSGQADGVFPRTVTHFQGQTTIEAVPTKVVVIATGQLDSALTLGVVPVGAAAGDGAGTVPDYLTQAFPEHA